MLNEQYILSLIRPRLNIKRELSEVEFFELFSELDRQEQYEVINIMIEHEIELVEEKEEETRDVLYVKVDSNEQYEDVESLLRLSPGKVETFVQFNGKLYKCKEKADINGALVSQLKGLLGEACVKTAKKK